jgi:hypothetical protein
MLYPRSSFFAFLTLAGIAAGSLADNQNQTESGFVPLFNGKDLTGWRVGKELLDGKTESSDKRFQVVDGVIVCNEGKGIKDLYTVKEFAKDFHLKLEFRASPRSDSGLYIRGPQLQVRDYPTVGPYKPKSFKSGDWNELDIVVHGNVTVATVNGKALGDQDVLEMNVKEGIPSAKLNGKPVTIGNIQVSNGPAALCKCNGEVLETAFKVPAKGGIGLQAETGKFEYRNVRIKEAP